MNDTKTTLLRTVAALSTLFGIGFAATLAAQTVPDTDVPQAGLDLPANLQIFGKVDPNVRKPTAIVNDTVITGTDVDQRMAMIVALNGIALDDKERQTLRLQILRQLIDETLQIQEAKSNQITITPAQLEQSFSRVAQNFKRTPDDMRKYLRDIGSSELSLKRQVEAELAWSSLLRRNVEWKVNVSEAEVAAILKRLEASKGTEEYHLKEIYLSATPDRAPQVFTTGQQMIEQMKKGAPFEYFASNFSEATTRAAGGDLDWVRAGVLPGPLAQAASTMQIGQIAGPIEVPGGFSILYLVDKRQVLTADMRDAKLNLRQVTKRFPAGTTQAQASSFAAEFATAAATIQGCGDVPKVAAAINAEVVDNDAVRIRDLPPQLQDIMLKLQIGQSTPPFGSPEQGVRVLVLCGRDDPKSAGLPTMERIQAQMEQERVNLRAQRMMRDLRRDAVVDYR